ncbi:acetyltransferase (GNAT) family protein [Bosea sp. AK1]|nr:acetyltransferase (GNAT) family protein [Bosea sp. AK1]
MRLIHDATDMKRSSMDQETIDLVAFEEHHLDGALQLSREAGWPHQREDWAMLLALSDGFVMLQGDVVVGTAMMTPFADESARIAMVIVAATMRGRGLGRRLMDAALQACGERECCLTATADGLPLYEKLGFRAAHEIRQHQGNLREGIAAPVPMRGIAWARAEDFATIAALDRQALGFDRRTLLHFLAETAQIAVLREGDRIAGFGALRPFGRGEVIGPVIAETETQAQAILSFLMNARTGTFLRVDTPLPAGLSPWLAACGLAHAGGGIAMRRNAANRQPIGPAQPFALASQALG